MEENSKKVFYVEEGKTTVSQLFKEGLLQYYADTKNNIFYVNEKDYGSIVERLKVKKLDEKTWQLDFGKLKGKFTVMSSDAVERTMTIEENCALGINDYYCQSEEAGKCLEMGQNSIKLLTAAYLCATPPALVCDLILLKTTVDFYNGSGCPGNPTRVEKTLAHCIQG